MGLLAKIESYGIHGNILKWLTSFLTQQCQKVLVNGKSSGWCDVLSGVPQGSVLGPILFIIFINDMPDKITSMVHLFADDTKISLRLTNQNQTNDLQNDIDRLDEWSDRWKLRFNVAQCKTMHIGYHNDKHIYQIGSGESRMDHNQVTSEKPGYYFPVYQTLGGQSQEGKLHARSYSSQLPTHRQRDAYTSLQGSRPSARGVCFKCVVTIQAL